MAPGGEETSEPLAGWDESTLERDAHAAFGPANALPRRIGPYETIEVVGEGGMGVVHRARHVLLDRIVALKVMRPELSSNRVFVERFLREARAAAAVDHTNVVTLYDAGFENSLLYMAFRYVQGGDLGTRIMRDGPLGEVEALEIMIECARGLEAIHAAHLVHRDIKPANILLDDTGPTRIADLGLARSVAARAEERLTVAGLPIGTPSFMSPEQVRGDIDVDIRTDIYALGMTLYATVTGRTPFTGQTAYETSANVLYKEPPDPREFAPELSPETSGVILRCISKKREDRYTNPTDMIQSLTECHHRVKVSSTQVGVRRTTLKREHTAPLPTSAQSLAALPAFDLAPFLPPVDQPPTPSSGAAAGLPVDDSRLVPGFPRQSAPPPTPTPPRTPTPASDAQRRKSGGIFKDLVRQVLFPTPPPPTPSDRTPAPPKRSPGEESK